MLDLCLVKARPHYTARVSFTLGSSRLAIFGPSGSGKSTVLSCLAGLETPDSGHIRWDGQNWFPPALALHARSVGYLSQQERLFPHLSVSENVLFALSDTARDKEHAWINEIRERLDLGPLWKTQPERLSGGQARRVALARALCRKPGLVLLDEPFTGLDRPLTRTLVAVLKDWQEQFGFTLLVVDHDPQILAALCPEVIALEQGQIVQRGLWAGLTEHPATPALRDLLDRSL